MKIKKLSIAIIAVAVISVIVLVSFALTSQFLSAGRNSSEKVIYFADHISDAHRKLINRFNELHKGRIRVEAIDLSFNKFSTNERKELLVRYLRSKSDRVDIFAVDQIWVPRFVKWSLNLDNYLDKSYKENLLEQAKQTCVVNDSLMALPLYLDLAVLIYRTDLIRALPEGKAIEKQLQEGITWEQLLSLQSQFPNRPLFIYQADDYEGLMCQFTELMSSYGQPMATADSLYINSPEAIKAATFLRNLVHSYKVSPISVLEMKENDSYLEFTKSGAPFVRGWPSSVDSDNPAFFEFRKDRGDVVAVGPTPYPAGNKKQSVFGGWNLILSKYSRNIPESVEFLKFVMSDEAQKILFEEGKFIPVSKSVFADKEFVRSNPMLTFYKEQLERGFHRPFFEFYTTISDVIAYYLNAIINNEYTPEQGLRLAEQSIKSQGIFLK